MEILNTIKQKSRLLAQAAEAKLQGLRSLASKTEEAITDEKLSAEQATELLSKHLWKTLIAMANERGKVVKVDTLEEVLDAISEDIIAELENTLDKCESA